MPEPARRLPIASTTSPSDLSHTLTEAKSHHLVLGIVGYAGSGNGYVATSLSEQLRSKGYVPVIVKVSYLIEEMAKRLGHPDARRFAERLSPIERTEILQAVGTWFREKFGASIAAGLVIRYILNGRSGAGPHAFIVDQLKHPKEVEVLRNVYKSSFYLVSVICHEDKRRRRLEVITYKNAAPFAIDRLVERDEADSGEMGQQVRKTLHLGDFFVNNDQDATAGPTAPIADDLGRFIDIIAGKEVIRPTRDERGMHAAWAASLRSSCLSRQVGASILDARGNLIATGTNDVPKFDGGLYEEGDSEGDHRCYGDKGNMDTPYCRNDLEKRAIYEDVVARLQKAGVLKEEADLAKVRAILASTRVGALIEFSRAVHAEMDAVVSLARRGAGTTQGAVLFSSTYPCHSCARHIVAAGIREVIYIEPYPKSLAVKLHGDSIEETTTPAHDSSTKVHFRLFSGVAPRRYASLFEKRGELKDNDGNAKQDAREVPEHNDFVYTKSFADFERDIANQVDEMEKEHAG